MNYDWEFFKSSVKALQREKRYFHTIGVANEAINLGKIFLPKKLDKLYFTGLLHDITKDFSTEKHIELCQKYGIELPSTMAPKLLHAKTGAEYAREKFGCVYVDDEVYSAIFKHTTGCENMTIFDIIIYLADYIESGRTFEDCVFLRNYFYANIKEAEYFDQKLEILRKTMVLSFDLTIKNLIEEEKIIDTDTINTRNYFIKNKITVEE